MGDMSPTAEETEFVDRLVGLVPGIKGSHHSDADGARWTTASYDNVVNGYVVATFRVDYDGTELTAGRGRTSLDQDGGARWRTTATSLGSPDGADEAARVAAEWFHAVTQGRA